MTNVRSGEISTQTVMISI